MNPPTVIIHHNKKDDFDFLFLNVANKDMLSHLDEEDVVRWLHESIGMLDKKSIKFYPSKEVQEKKGFRMEESFNNIPCAEKFLKELR